MLESLLILINDASLCGRLGAELLRVVVARHGPESLDLPLGLFYREVCLPKGS